MPLPPESGRELDEAVQRAEVEHRRAVRAAEIAARHETQMLTAAEGMRALHARMAVMHRQAEQQHRTAARIHTAHADRLRRWAEGSQDPQAPSDLMAAACETLGASGAAFTLFGTDQTEVLTAASNPASRTAQHLEFTFGQGPARETVRLHRPVIAAGTEIAATWPIYGPAVERLGIGAVAAVPVAMAGQTLGALTVFDPPMADGPDAEGPDLEAFEATAETLVASLEPPPLSGAYEEFTRCPSLVGQADLWAVVNQAAGMVSVQCRCGTADALALIRAHAFAENRPVDEVAADIVARTLRLS
ncbi:ANTAR domain-containing protein [Catenulispora sp. NF23]|uniref:ANTAR domain-containing protein n=1 Tax=Catenulispora pinistramenti TaxID=2705254 RepID=A0ABS5KKS3_9ACTN|nr:ANTAR domain-containing protein [Catenulispora pinistramenti]MBS2531181.1 ANTAR domain-containing protein [Catenulispora pinistramenti]MBS2546638.1 ANTAR domain-containing protein [Catenulispora pinistramenti]